jgi:hypothetical protein
MDKYLSKKGPNNCDGWRNESRHPERKGVRENGWAVTTATDGFGARSHLQTAKLSIWQKMKVACCVVSMCMKGAHVE